MNYFYILYSFSEYNIEIFEFSQIYIYLTIFWNPNGLQVMNGMESGQRFNSSYFIERILKKMALDECVAKAKKKQTKIHPPYG